MRTGQDFEAPGLRKAPAERWASRVLPGAGIAWTAAEAMHLAGIHAGTPAGVATALGAVVAWGTAGRGKAPESLPWWIAIEGGWFAAAEALGPLTTWHHTPYLTIAQLVIGFTAARAARKSGAVVEAREWREQREEWLAYRARAWHLGGSHLISFERTRLGELYEVNTRGTGKRAAQVVASPLAEFIAEEEGLAENRVRVWKHKLAGRIFISIRRVDPWEHPLLHPVAVDDHEISLPERRSILHPAMVGQDPETGNPLPVTLYDKAGGKNVSVTGIKGAGKGVLLDDLSEWVTGCYDAMQVRLNLSVKGYAEPESWGPCCYLTAFGPEQADRAVKVLTVLASVIEWRARSYKRGQYKPSAADPAIVVFVDESDSAMMIPAVRALLNLLATKGREYGIVYIHAGQRNTRDYNDPKAKAQDDVRCTGMVANANESRHAGSTAGPDMATYGEGHSGVWKVEELGRGVHLGRTWVFSDDEEEHGAAVERIACDRAEYQPELPAACQEYLGDALAELLETEVYTIWAHHRDSGEYPYPVTDEAGDAPVPDAEVPADPVAPAGRGGTAPVLPASRTVVAEPDDLEELWRMDLPPDAAQRNAAVRARLGNARKELAELAALPSPSAGTDPAEHAAQVAERWRQFGERASIPADAMPRLVELLGDGTTSTAVAAEFGITKDKALGWLARARNEKFAYVDGKKRGSKWRLATPPGDQNSDGE